MEGAIIMANRIITINRMYGSNGRKIGEALAQKLGIHYYDKELIQIASEKEGIPYDELLKVDEKRASQGRYPLEDPLQMAPQYRFYPMNDVLFQSECEIIHSIAQKEDCIIIGRCANSILKENCFSVFIHAPFETRVQNVAARLNISEKDAAGLVKKSDKDRRSYYEYFADRKWMDMQGYDLCIDSSRVPEDQIIAMLAAVYNSL